MQIAKTLINDHLRVSEVSEKFHIPTFCNFVVICYFLEKQPTF